MKNFRLKKFFYYIRHFIYSLIPSFYLRARLNHEIARISQFDAEEMNERLNYYNKLRSPFLLDSNSKTFAQVHRKDLQSFYYFDFKQYIRYFPIGSVFDYKFFDFRGITSQPSFVKSRKISQDNENCILLRLATVRHFNFVNDRRSFESKKNIAVFRGPCHQKHRKVFLESCYLLPKTDIGDTRKSVQSEKTYKPFMSIANQLEYKFIISVEGNDVATNLKWIMSSNSLCFMTKPQCETWFMEGSLVPDFHYVLLKDDYSDLVEKIDYYTQNTKAGLEIIKNAQTYVSQFQDPRKEKLLSLLVMKKYFDLSLAAQHIA